MKYNFICTIGICFIIFSLIIFSNDAKQGAINGIYLCENIIIPSLLPIIILTNTLIKSKCSYVFELLFGKLTEKIFKLPRCCATAIIFGLIGGYPSGAILTNSLYQNGQISKSEASRIMTFNFCGGIAFIITAVGAITLGSIKIGVILYLSNLFSSFIILFCTSIFSKSELHNNELKIKKLNLTDALIESVEQAVNSLLLMCVYIILFSSMISIIKIPNYIYPFIEITNGICGIKTSMPIEYCAFFISFGGFCIHFQLLDIIKSFKMNYFEFLFFRVLSGIISFLLVKIYFYFFPQDTNVFSNLSSITPKATEINAGFGLIMIIGCAVLIYDIGNRKIGCRKAI